MSGLSVIIPSRSIDNLRPCVAAVRKHEADAHVIVIWDAPKTGDPRITDWWSAQQVLNEYGRIGIVLRGEQPFIFARNCNIGIRATGEDDVILLNDDALLESPGGFSLLQTAAQEHPSYGIIGAVTNLTGQPLQHRDVQEAAHWARGQAAERRMRGQKTTAQILDGYPFESGDGLREVGHIAFVCVLIPRRTIRLLASKATGTAVLLGCSDTRMTDGLDERYCLDWGCEDADYCEQVARAGLKIGVHDGCYVDHGSLRSTRRGDPRTPTDFRQNYRLLVDKWGGYLITQPSLRHLRIVG